MHRRFQPIAVRWIVQGGLDGIGSQRCDSCGPCLREAQVRGSAMEAQWVMRKRITGEESLSPVPPKARFRDVRKSVNH